MLFVFGHAVFILLFGGMLWRQACRWRYLAKSYAADGGPVLEKRTMRSAVLIGLGAFNSLKGIITISIHPTGVSFRVMKLFSLFHQPLFVPFSDIRGWKTTWYLDARSSELEFRAAPSVKVILPATEAEWIKSKSADNMMLRDVRPPHGNVGRGWHVFTVVNAIVSLAMLVWLATVLLQK